MRLIVSFLKYPEGEGITPLVPNVGEKYLNTDW